MVEKEGPQPEKQVEREPIDDLAKLYSGICEKKVIAQIFGFSGNRRVEQLTYDGVIDATLVAKNGHQVQMYDLIPTIRKYIRYLSERAYGKGNRTEREIELREQKMAADVALRESQGELHRLKTAIAAGEYISVEEVRLDYAKFFVTFKKFAMSLPARVSGMLSGRLEATESRRIEKELSGEIASLLASFVVAGVVRPVDVKDIINGEKAKAEEMAQEIPDN